MATVSFHFHGYQPGDIVRWVEADPFKPPRSEERASPVAHRIGGDRVEGRNWTDAVLRSYGRMEMVLERAAGAASADIEPQTLAWLLERDESAYRRVLAAYEKGLAGLALTPPFHPILPHHHRLDREILFEMMIDFYAPLLRRAHGKSMGLWLPEAAYSAETMESYLLAARRAEVELENLPDLTRDVHLILDERQLKTSSERTAWHRTPSTAVVARDHGLSDDFAFGSSTAKTFGGARLDGASESVLVAADLESLLANPAQAQRFEGIVETLRDAGHTVSSPTPPPNPPPAEVVDFSSWSDYAEHPSRGHTSDTRWTGLRRADGLVVGRMHGRRRISQLWKHAFTLATEQVETAVRRTARDLLPGRDDDWKREVLRRLAVAYGRHLWRDHYRALGLSSGDTDFARAVSVIAGELDPDAAAYLARAYVTMLMGLRSDPRFWDNPDTRVTFQNVACLTQALMDAGEACVRAGKRDLRERLIGVLRAAMLEFSEAFVRLGFSDWKGTEGWETTEAAWFESLQSEVPRRTRYDVVRRAALYALADRRAEVVVEPLAADEIVADTGHIAGELHGEWANRNWCEHRL